MGMVNQYTYSFCQVIVLSLSRTDEIILEVTVRDHPLKLELDFFLDLVISIGSFTDEIFGQTFDDIGIGDYRVRIHFGSELVVLTIIEVGDDISLGPNSILSIESHDLAEDILRYLEEENVHSSPTQSGRMSGSRCSGGISKGRYPSRRTRTTTTGSFITSSLSSTEYRS